MTKAKPPAARPELTTRPSNGVAKFFLLTFIVLLSLAVIAAGAAYGGYRWLQAEFASPGPAENETVITLPRGIGLIRIASQLDQAGLISDPRIFRAGVMLDGGEGNLRAGEYAVPALASMADIYELLRTGHSIQHPLTFAEGLTSAMIVASLAGADVLTGDVTEIPAEGTLLPETYLVDRGTDRQDVIDRMRAAQQSLLDELWPARAENLPFETREEALILASVVEKETGLASERRDVAAVYVNRLRRGMRLESDPTIIYGITRGAPLGRGLRQSELDNAANSWNTYRNSGLPPTAIANPGRESIAAVLNPSDSRALFFVADGTGGHAFAATYAEHQRNVARWRQMSANAVPRGIDMADLSGMTGFARAEAAHEAFRWVWEVRSVNGKGLEARFRFPPGYDRLEAAARELAKARFARGNIQASLILHRDTVEAGLRLDTVRIDAILAAAQPYVASGQVQPMSFDGLLSIRGVLDGEDRSEPVDTGPLDSAILDSLGAALDDLRANRLIEGSELKALLAEHVSAIETLTAEAATSAAVRVDVIRDRIAGKYAELLPQGLDPERLAIEAAAMAVKMDVREELDRLQAHVRAARDLLEAGSPTGRKLDFLSQEFNREANTLCSKSSDSSLTQIGLAMKNTVDQFREQVQNVE